MIIQPLQAALEGWGTGGAGAPGEQGRGILRGASGQVLFLSERALRWELTAFGVRATFLGYSQERLQVALNKAGWGLSLLQPSLRSLFGRCRLSHLLPSRLLPALVPRPGPPSPFCPHFFAPSCSFDFTHRSGPCRLQVRWLGAPMPEPFTSSEAVLSELSTVSLGLRACASSTAGLSTP